jgi:hypothetical protein
MPEQAPQIPPAAAAPSESEAPFHNRKAADLHKKAEKISLYILSFCLDPSICYYFF